MKWRHHVQYTYQRPIYSEISIFFSIQYTSIWDRHVLQIDQWHWALHYITTTTRSLLCDKNTDSFHPWIKLYLLGALFWNCIDYNLGNNIKCRTRTNAEPRIIFCTKSAKSLQYSVFGIHICSICILFAAKYKGQYMLFVMYKNINTLRLLLGMMSVSK